MKFVLLILSTFVVIAQDDHLANQTAEKPVALYSGLGTWHHPIGTANSEAQKFFDQGLILMYGFNRYEALRSFRKASELDPHAGMVYWGIAMALGPYLNMDMDPSYQIKNSCDAAKTGLSRQGISETDRIWLNAAVSRCPDYSNPARYASAMREVADRFPDDPDAQTLYAEALILPVRWHCYDQAGKPAPGVSEAEHILESALLRFPNHPGANHLYIHIVEASPTPERAVQSATRLMGIVPAAGHMVHMPAHIWLVLGDFDNVVAVNERAAAVDREYFAKAGVIGSYYAYYLHNLHFILYARAMQGRRADTDAAAKQFSDAVKAVADMMPDMAAMFGATGTMTQLRLREWDEVLRIEHPRTQDALTNALWHYTRAIASAGKNDVETARREQAEFESLRAKLDRNTPWDTNKLGDVMDVASAVLDARLTSSPRAAIPKWEKAVRIQDSLAYDEPPAWYYPVRESLGGALLRAGDPARAEAVFREGLRRSPNNGRMLFGLLESLKAQGKTDAASWVQREFDRAWHGADIELRVDDL